VQAEKRPQPSPIVGLPKHRTDTTPHRRDERAEMFCAVIRLAWSDIFEVPKVLDRYADKVQTREEALRFLTDADGKWAAHREFICSLSGDEDGDRLRARVLYQMYLTPPPEIRMTDSEKRAAERRTARSAPKPKPTIVRPKSTPTPEHIAARRLRRATADRARRLKRAAVRQAQPTFSEAAE